MEETTETIQQPDTFQVQDNHCWYDGEAVDICVVFAVGFLFGWILD